jgi:hypothetical protein
MLPHQSYPEKQHLHMSANETYLDSFIIPRQGRSHTLNRYMHTSPQRRAPNIGHHAGSNRSFGECCRLELGCVVCNGRLGKLSEKGNDDCEWLPES